MLISWQILLVNGVCFCVPGVYYNKYPCNCVCMLISWKILLVNVFVFACPVYVRVSGCQAARDSMGFVDPMGSGIPADTMGYSYVIPDFADSIISNLIIGPRARQNRRKRIQVFGMVHVIEVGSALDCPSLVSFPVGVPPDCEDMRLELGQKVKGKKRRRLVVTSTDGLVFRGCDYGEHDSSKNVMQFAIACVDESGRVKILPTDHAFIMRPDLIDKSNIVAPARLSSLTSIERREKRTDEFGSRKKMRALQVASSNEISAQNISGASAVQSAMERSIENEGERSNDTQEAMEKNRGLYLPPFNAAATEAMDIYPLDDIIPEDSYDALDVLYGDMCAAAMAAAGDETDSSGKVDPLVMAKNLQSIMRTKEGAASCVLNGFQALIQRLKKCIDKGNDKRARNLLKSVCRSLFLVHFMIRFHHASTAPSTAPRAHAAKGKQWQVQLDIEAPEAVSVYLMKTFTSSHQHVGRNSFNKMDKERLKTHMMALLLHIQDFSPVDLTVLAADLKLGEQGLVHLARQMGCKVLKVKEMESHQAAILRAPLAFPAMKRPIVKK